MSAPDPIPLLSDLVRSLSVSGEEGPALETLRGWLESHGVSSDLLGRNLVAGTGPEDGAVLLMNAHIDTVPAGPGWTRDPLGGEVEGDRLFGLGSNDNKGSLAAMACAMVELSRRDLPGRILFAATCDEETGGDGLEWLRPRLPGIHQAVLSEPTNFRVAVAQRGLVRLTARTKGRTAHASRPHEGVNAIRLAMEDLARLLAIDLGEPHPLLGRATLEVTMVEGGTAANVLPGECTFTVDGRPTPGCDNETFVAGFEKALVHSEIVTLKARMTPVTTPANSPVARAALAATGTDEPVALEGVSDLFHVRDLPAVVVGPGTHDQSHQPDESVSVSAVRKAVGIYETIAVETLKGASR